MVFAVLVTRLDRPQQEDLAYLVKENRILRGQVRGLAPAAVRYVTLQRLLALRRARRVLRPGARAGPTAGERAAPVDHLVEHHTEGKEVGSGVQRPARSLLRRHVRDRADDRAGVCARVRDRGRL
jgi:hypothetical protein